MNKMTRVDVSEQELEVFLNVADRLGIGVRDLLEKDVPFREMELAGHELGRAIAQMTKGATGRPLTLAMPATCG
jgi:Trp operon repressor